MSGRSFTLGRTHVRRAYVRKMTYVLIDLYPDDFYPEDDLHWEGLVYRWLMFGR